MTKINIASISGVTPLPPSWRISGYGPDNRYLVPNSTEPEERRMPDSTEQKHLLNLNLYNCVC